MENSIQQKNIGLIMNKGFEKAAKSFSMLVNRPLSFSYLNMILVHHDQEFSYMSGQQGNLMVLTTNMIGELSGKSYLILNEQERAEICQSVSPTKELDIKLQEALLLEIDNIVSASVIGQLADELGIEVYGDVPHLQYVKSEKIQEFLSSSISNENPSTILLCDTTFVLDNHNHINPKFIWKLSEKIFKMIERQPSL
jgi:chemotaxis protein CheY-P-specific phosphatase CheC